MYVDFKSYYNHINGSPLKKREFVRRHGKFTKKLVREHLRHVHQRISDRYTFTDPSTSRNYNREWLGKWCRPWDLVPKLKNYRAPNGEFAVGLEVELGFKSHENAVCAGKFLHKMRYVTADFEGGQHPVEATFPPFRYNRLNKNNQVFRYLKFVAENDLALEQLSDYAGTHVNVSMGGRRGCRKVPALGGLNRELSSLSYEQKERYFGRRNPYGYLYKRGRFIEMKLFKSSTDGAVIRRYINIAIAIAEFAYKKILPTQEELVAALEIAYNK